MTDSLEEIKAKIESLQFTLSKLGEHDRGVKILKRDLQHYEQELRKARFAMGLCPNCEGQFEDDDREFNGDTAALYIGCNECGQSFKVVYKIYYVDDN